MRLNCAWNPLPLCVLAPTCSTATLWTGSSNSTATGQMGTAARCVVQGHQKKEKECGAQRGAWARPGSRPNTACVGLGMQTGLRL